MRKVHNDDDYGHGGEQRTYALAQKEFPALGITRSDVKEFIKYCVACQKRSFNKFDVPHQPIEDRLLNLMIADVWIIGEVHEKEKLAFLAVMDLKSRYVFLEELPLVQRTINSSEHESIGVAPVQLIFPNVDLNRMFPFEDCDNTDRTERSLSEYVMTQIELREVYLNM